MSNEESERLRREYWGIGVRVDDSWMNGCFVMRALFSWIEVVDWGG